MNEAYHIYGVPKAGGLLVAADHASNIVPDNLNLGLDPYLLDDHIAYDIGTEPIAKMIAETGSGLAITGGQSRLVVDLNRYPDEAAVIPLISDGIKITSNELKASERAERVERYYHPYHERLSALIADINPFLVISLHSFTPTLRTAPELKRPWEIGVLYNDYAEAARLALPFLEGEGLIVGDQKPYSGKDLNATMNRQAEAVGQAYIGIEIRQDLISHETGQRRFTDILIRMSAVLESGLARGV